jgi:hypothetical protein
MADRLVALAHIRTDLGFTHYRPGDTLPENHPDAAAWVESGAAVWRSDDYTPPTWVKARMAAAEPGIGGIAVGGEATGGDLAGKVPRTPERTAAWRR